MSTEDKDQSNAHRTQIIAALIGLVGVLGAALIAHWDTVFSTRSRQAGQTQAPGPTTRSDGSGAQPQPRLEPGVYLLRQGRKGDQLTEDMLSVAEGDSRDGRPTKKSHVVNMCLVKNVTGKRHLTLRDIDLCASQ